MKYRFLIATSIFLYGVLSFGGLNATKDAHRFDLSAISSFIADLNTWKHFPSIDGESVETNPHSKDIPQWLLDDFLALQIAAFGRNDVLTISTCTNNVEEGTSCLMQMDSKRKIVFVNPDFLNQYNLDVIRFALAHEISHYIYELGVLYVKPVGESLFKNNSLFSNRPLNLEDLNQMEREKVFEQQVLSFGRGHSEVDYYGAFLSKKVYKTLNFDEVIAFLKGTMTGQALNESSQKVVKFRVTSIQKFLLDIEGL